MEPLTFVAASFALVKLADSAPAKALLDQAARFIGPWHDRREKVMNVDTQLAVLERIKSAGIDDEGKAELELALLGSRTLERWTAEQLRHQANMEAITVEALKQLPQNAQVRDIDIDWLEHFYSAARMISREEGQLLWAKVLVSEATKPSSFSKRSLEALRLFDRLDGECLQLVASRSIVINGEPFSSMSAFYNPDPDPRPGFARAHAIGLVHDSFGNGTTPVIYPDELDWSLLVEFYAGGRIFLRRKESGRFGTRTGGAPLTSLGKELVTLPDVQLPDDVLRVIYFDQYKQHHIHYEDANGNLIDLSKVEQIRRAAPSE